MRILYNSPMPVSLPEELVNRTAEGKTVLFVGAGIKRLEFWIILDAVH